MPKAPEWNWKFIVKRNNGYDYFYARMPGGTINKPGRSYATQHFRSAFLEKSAIHLDMLARANPGIVFQIFTREGDKVGLPLFYMEGDPPKVAMP